MLEIRFKENCTENDKTSFGIAVHCAGVKMTIQMIDDQIEALDKKIKNEHGTYTDDEVIGFMSKKEDLEKNRKECVDKEADLLPVYEAVRDAMIGDNYNDPGNVDNVLRCIAAAQNSKLEKYALPELGTIDMYENLMICHDIKRSNEHGGTTMSKEVKTAYESASNSIAAALRTRLSLEETDYMEKVSIRFNKTDMRLIHETFITSFSNSYEVENDKNGVEISRKFDSVKVATSITVKKGKNGNKYNFTKFNTIIARLVIGKLAK